MSTSQKVSTIISWCCQNSVHENEKLLYQNSKLAGTHFKNLENPMTPYTDKADTKLVSMYSSSLIEKSIYQICYDTLIEVV